MKVCFRYENFDRDVSSGTEHAMYQWYTLMLAFNVSEVANNTISKVDKDNANNVLITKTVTGLPIANTVTITGA